MLIYVIIDEISNKVIVMVIVWLYMEGEGMVSCCVGCLE